MVAHGIDPLSLVASSPPIAVHPGISSQKALPALTQHLRSAFWGSHPKFSRVSFLQPSSSPSVIVPPPPPRLPFIRSEAAGICPEET